MTLLVGFAVWFAVGILVALVAGRVLARRNRYIPPPPHPHHRKEKWPS